MGKTDENGINQVFFQLNGQTRSIDVKAKNFTSPRPCNKKSSMKTKSRPLQGKLPVCSSRQAIKWQRTRPVYIEA